jgi:dodecin
MRLCVLMQVRCRFRCVGRHQRLHDRSCVRVTCRHRRMAAWRYDRLAAKPGLDSKSAKDSDMSVYRVTEIIGTSSTSWEDAAAEAIRTAAGTLRDLRVAEVVKQDIHLDEGGAITYRTKLQLSFKYEHEH